MHHEAILVVAADLQHVFHHIHGKDIPHVRVGPETARVCQKAAEVAKEHPEAAVYATAGFSPKFRTQMGAGPMRDYLIGCGVPAKRIRTPTATEFNTNGEMVAFTHDFFPSSPWSNDTFVIYQVCRWWHTPRALALLKGRIRPELKNQVTIKPVLVQSLDPRMVLETLAWIKNILNGNIRP